MDGPAWQKHWIFLLIDPCLFEIISDQHYKKENARLYAVRAASRHVHMVTT